MLKQASEGSLSLPAQVCKIVKIKSVISKLTFLPPKMRWFILSFYCYLEKLTSYISGDLLG